MVSRRSRFRAGTRLQRRGADELGHVANYVETEQIASFAGHVFAWVQVNKYQDFKNKSSWKRIYDGLNQQFIDTKIIKNIQQMNKI